MDTRKKKVRKKVISTMNKINANFKLVVMI